MLAVGYVRGADEIIVTVRDGSVDFGEETLFGTFDSGEAIALGANALGALVGNTANPLVFVRIYDVTGANGGTPVHTIGPVTINVLSGTGATRPREIRVLVGPPPNASGQFGYNDYLFNPLQPMPFAGARGFTSLTINEPPPGTGQPLIRDQTRIALSVFGGDVGRVNQNDRIDVGQIYRVQADARVLPDTTLEGGQVASR